MLSRFYSAVVLGCLVVVPVTAQTVRFDTNVGTFDLELNPTGNVNLQGHVDNMLAYVNAGRYDLTVINRAAENFVMQLGGFQLDTLELPSAFSAFPSVSAFADVVVDANNDGTVDFDLTGLNNTRGTVSLALGGGDPNSGSSSFFVNVNDNLGLDGQNFVTFATVSDFATIDLIYSLEQANLNDGGLAADDIPILDSNRLVFIERAFVLDTFMGPIAPSANSLNSSLANAFSSNPPVALQAISVPEPPALVLAAGALMLFLAMKRPQYT